jgi:hypothetical protein
VGCYVLEIVKVAGLEHVARIAVNGNVLPFFHFLLIATPNFARENVTVYFFQRKRRTLIYDLGPGPFQLRS